MLNFNLASILVFFIILTDNFEKNRVNSSFKGRIQTVAD